MSGEEGGISGLIQQPPAEMGQSLGGETRVLSPIGAIPTHLPLEQGQAMFGDVGKDALKRDPGLALHAVEEVARLLIAHLGRVRNGGSHEGKEWG